MKTLLLNLVDKIKSNLKLYAIAALIVLLGLFGFKACRKHDKKVDSDVSSPVLTPDQKEKIVVDPVKHTITVITRNPDGSTKETKTYLPDRPTAVIEDKNGKLTIIERKYGSEMRPYLGVGGSLDGTPRIHLGADLFYFKKLDLGTDLDLNASVVKTISSFKDTRISANVSYNVYSNTSVALSIDNHKTVGLFIKVRI
jgi:hypothetical protein